MTFTEPAHTLHQLNCMDHMWVMGRFTRFTTPDGGAELGMPYEPQAIHKLLKAKGILSYSSCSTRWNNQAKLRKKTKKISTIPVSWFLLRYQSMYHDKPAQLAKVFKNKDSDARYTLCFCGKRKRHNSG